YQRRTSSFTDDTSTIRKCRWASRVGMSRTRKARSVATVLPASGAFFGSGAHSRTYDSTRSSASASETPLASRSSRPELVCMSFTSWLIWSIACCGGLMTRSTPSPRMLSSPSVTNAATSIKASVARSSPVISQSIHTRRSYMANHPMACHAAKASRRAWATPFRQRSRPSAPHSRTRSARPHARRSSGPAQAATQPKVVRYHVVAELIEVGGEHPAAVPPRDGVDESCQALVLAESEEVQHGAVPGERVHLADRRAQRLDR